MSSHGKPDRRSFLKAAGAAGAAGLGGLGGCIGSGGGGGAGGPFKVGYLSFLSGPVGAAGTAHERGVEIGLEEVTDAGGMNGHEVEWITKDTKASPDTAAKRARQLIDQDDVDVLTGCTTSASGKGLNQFAAQQDIPLLLAATQTPDVTKKECQPTTFRLTTNIITQQVTLAEAVARLTPDDATRVAGVNPDYVYGHQSWEVFKAEFQKRRPDAEFVSPTFPAFLKGDYKKEIQKMLNAGPDIVQSTLFSGDMIAFIKQALQFNFFDQVEHFASGSLDPVAAALGDQMVEAICFNPTWWGWEDNERMQDFTETYVERHNTIPDGFFSAYGRANVSCLKAAVERSGGISRDDLVSGLEGLTFESVLPKTRIRKGDHQAIPDVQLAGRYGPVDDDPLPDQTVYGYVELDPVPADVLVKSDPDECEAF